MAHLGTNYTSFSNFIDRADAFWTVDFETLNSSGVTGTGVLAVNTEEDGTRYLNVSIAAKGLTPDVQHAQHIHGLFDDDGNPIDSQTPTIADDADRDGMVEVLEGFGQYGDIILTLLSDGALPTADANGEINFIQNYDLGDASQFFSPFGNDYTSDDLMPLELREIVLHGQNVPTGIGAGTEGEINGEQDGFVGILPVLAGEIVSVDQAEALDVLEDQMTLSSQMTTLTADADTFDGGAGEDTILGGAGDDSLFGGANDDFIDGQAGADVLSGDLGADTLLGSAGADMLTGEAGADVLSGGTGNDSLMAGENDTNAVNAADAAASGALTRADYDNAYAGGVGDDLIMGGVGDDIITGDDDSRVSVETGETFDMTADGADSIFGGAGNDEIHTGTWADSDDGFENTHTGAASDFASGGDGNDILIGDNGTDTLRGDAGEDTVKAGGGADFVDGGTGDDTLEGGAGADSIYGGADNDVLLGETGADLLVGQAGNDVLTGGAGSDLLVGGDGDDFINGGFANDRINTGEGADKVFHAGVAGHGTDFVQDFDGENDIFVFGGSAEATADDFLLQTAIIENAGADDVAEAFITYVPTGQVLWTAIDGDALETINVMAGGEVFDLLA